MKYLTQILDFHDSDNLKKIYKTQQKEVKESEEEGFEPSVRL